MRSFFCLFLIVSSLLFSSYDEVARFLSQDSIEVAADTVIDKSVYYMASDVHIEGTLKKNLYVICSHLEILGEVQGSVYAIAMSTDIEGRIGRGLYLSSIGARISGEVLGRAYLFVGDLELMPGSNVEGKIFALTGYSQFSSRSIQHNIDIMSGRLSLGGTINGDVNAIIGNLSLLDNSHITGSLTYWSREELDLAKSARVDHHIIKKLPEVKAKPFAKTSIFLKLASFISLFVIGIVLLKLAPYTFYETVRIIRQRPIKTFILGFLAVAFIPLIIIVCLTTMIGIPLAVNLLALYLINLYVIKLYAIFACGVLVLKRKSNKLHIIWVLLIALFAYYLVSLIPILGFLITLWMLFWGFGVVLALRKRFSRIIRQHTLPAWD